MAKLPLIQLPDCPHCFTSGQGTRAKGGNSVRCAGCGVMRRVPGDRRTHGTDDPRASVPVRGRPLKPGHPYRFQPGDTAGPRRPAATTAGRSSSGRQTAAQGRQRPNTAGRNAPASETFLEIVRRLKDDPNTPLKLTTETGDGTDCQDVARIAAAFDEKYPKFGLFWEPSKSWKSVKFWIDRSEFSAPRFEMPRENLNQTSQRIISQPPRRMPIQQPRQPVARPTYVNPDTCPHSNLAYDNMADCYRCPDCSYARPAFG